VTPGSGSYDPNAFTCATDPDGWQTSEPADKSTVKAVRVDYQMSAVRGSNNAPLQVFMRVKDSAVPPQDVWEFGEIAIDGVWQRPSRSLDPADQGNGPLTPGTRYPFIGSGRDIMRVIGATPALSKAVDRTVLTPGEAATYTLTYSANGSGDVPATVDGYQIVDTLPVGLSYVAGSASPEPVVSTGGGGEQVLTWTLDGVPTNAPQTLTYQAVASDSVTPGERLVNTAVASYGGSTTADANATVTVATDGFTLIIKSADAPYIPNPTGDGIGTGSWTVTLRSFDPLPQAFTDVIDLLPYNGDPRGSEFSGSYTVQSVTAPPGATVYYTTDDRDSLSDDPADPSNGSPGDVTGATVQWSTTPAPDATAIRVIGGELAPGADSAFTVTIATDGAQGGDVFVNRAQARVGHTQLVMRTSASITVANYYEATLKKYVQDVNGTWHDANEPGDYPAFQFGDTINYRVVVTNTGQGTLTNIDVADDLQPALGAFHIDSLAPGASETHEYSIVLDESAVGPVVNTASATADTPDDSGVPPTIPNDPAGFDVTNYVTAKVSAPPSGEPVAPGDTIQYTLTVTQQGSIEAPATLTDDLNADVLDDASYNGDAAADIGMVDVTDGVLSWSGTVPVGGIATITYSVTVHDADALADTDTSVVNTVVSPGCVPADGGFPDCTTSHQVGWFTIGKVSDPASAASVGPGDTVDYTVTVAQHGSAAVPAAAITDDLSEVLDDATYNDDAAASSGTVNFAEPTLGWTGDLGVGQTVTITYSVTVAGDGDLTLSNAVTTPDRRGRCDDEIGCSTTHPVGKYIFSKVADPPPGSTVSPGDTVGYTITVTQVGPGTVTAATVVDDLSGVLDDAGYNGDAAASAGTVTVSDGALTWLGDLAVGQTVTITYSVTVTGGGDGELANVLSSPDRRGICDDQIGCRTDHPLGWFTFAKTAEVESGTTVAVGDVLTYTVTVSQHGPGALSAVSVADDLSGALDAARYDGDAAASSGTVSYAEPILGWNGDLAVGQTVTITYSLTVTDGGDAELDNVVTTTDPRGLCDESVGCRTAHPLGWFSYAKVADPHSGSTVAAGATITYRITVTQHGPGAVGAASVTDDMHALLDDASYNGDAVASAGRVSVDGGTLEWLGDLTVGQAVTITYSVRVTGDGDRSLVNTVTSQDPRGSCDTSIGCVVRHGMLARSGLAATGTSTAADVAVAVILLLLGSGALALDGRRRRRTHG
jgi:uncharacterized repeat protein (TIGR01451 family)